MARRSIFYGLPTELQAEVTKYLDPTDVNLTLSHTINRNVIEDQIKRNTPSSLPERLAYYERIGYQLGIYQFLPRGRLLNEGVSTLVLREVGKRGDSKMLKFLRSHGIINVDAALASAILSHQNTFVREEINTPIADLDSLLQAALDSDNLEMMRLLAPRFRDKLVLLMIRTNRTSFWYAWFSHYSDTAYTAGLGSDRQGGMFNATLSDLTEPLPFTYEQVAPYIDVVFIKRFVTALREGETTNYTRLERMLDILIERVANGSFVIAVSTSWIRALLPLVGNSMARGVMERCERLLGVSWREITGPITSPEQLRKIVDYVTTMITSTSTISFVPVQPEALEMWLNECLNGRFVRGVRASDEDDQFFWGLLFILYYYPGGEFSRNPNPAWARTFTKVDGSPFDFHGTLLRFFEKKPIPVMHRILEYRLTDVWDEIVKSDRLQLRPLDTLDGLDDLMPLLKGAALGGVNDLYESLSKMYIDSLAAMKKSGVSSGTLDPYEQRLHRVFIKTGKFPRLEIDSTGSTVIETRPPLRTNEEDVLLADAKLAENEEFIAERLQFLPR